jgi:hypothetical protein
LSEIFIFFSRLLSVIYIYSKGHIMGRKKLYITEDEQRDAKSQRNKRYYDKHKQRINKDAMRRYYSKKDSGDLRVAK